MTYAPVNYAAKGPLNSLGDYENYKREFYKAFSHANPYTGGYSNDSSSNLAVQGNDAAAAQARENEAAQAAYGQDQSAAWMKMLNPQQQAQYWQMLHGAQAKNKHLGQLAALGAFGGIAGAGALGAGMLGSGAGATGAGAADAAGGAMGAGDWMMGAPAWGGMGDAAGGAVGAGDWMMGAPAWGGASAGGSGALGGLGDVISKVPGAIGNLVGGGGNQNGPGLGGLLGLGGLGLLSQYYNNSKMPGVPDFMHLAQLSGVSANPNQTNAQGDTSSWTLDPVTGQRTQSVKYGAGNQQAFDQRQVMAQALRSKIMNQPATAAPMQQVNLGNLWG